MGGSFASEVLELEPHGSVAVLWLNRPEARNAMGPAFWSDLPLALDRLGGDAPCGPSSSRPGDRTSAWASTSRRWAHSSPAAALAGRDRRPAAVAPSSAPGVTARQGVLRMQASITSVAQCPKPVIAAVHGYCIGGGVDVVSACDMRRGRAPTPSSRCRETKVAIVADLGSLQRLPRHHR